MESCGKGRVATSFRRVAESQPDYLMRMAICMITTARTVAPIAIQAHPLIAFSLSGVRMLGQATLYRKAPPDGHARNPESPVQDSLFRPV